MPSHNNWRRHILLLSLQLRKLNHREVSHLLKVEPTKGLGRNANLSSQALQLILSHNITMPVWQSLVRQLPISVKHSSRYLSG